MKKRLLSLLLTGVLALGLIPSALAVPPETEISQILAALDIMKGYPDGQLHLEQKVNRAEFTKMLIAASPMGENVGDSTAVSPYPDVPSSHWAAPYVEAAVSHHLVNGFLDGTFRPGQTITLAEGVTMTLRLLGYQDQDFSGVWPAGQMALYRSLELDEGITTQSSAPMTRRDTMCLFYNLLTAPTKEGKPYLTMLGKPLTSSGEIDRVALINEAMEGPVVMAPGWTDKIGFDLHSSVTVYRADLPSSLDALQPNDVLYYSNSMRTIWAYTSKLTGPLQSVSPTADNPTSVTVAGRTYPIETADAAYALSNLGGRRIGDSVTLLFGRSGGVAAVVDMESVTNQLYGVVTSVERVPMTDGDGNPYTVKAAHVTATDGSSYTYPLEGRVSVGAGDLVQVTISGHGTKLQRMTQITTSGKFNGDGTMLGRLHLAENVEILDSNSRGNVLKIYPSRLGGMELKTDDVRYYRMNQNQEIDMLILNDATGDLYAYGVVTASIEDDPSGNGMPTSGFYQYDVGGQTYAYTSPTKALKAKVGPAKIMGSLAAPEGFKEMESVKLTSVDTSTATTNEGTTFPVSSSVAVYEQINGIHHFSSLERVRTDYHLTGYYDAPVSEGGCIRLIVATPIS